MGIALSRVQIWDESPHPKNQLANQQELFQQIFMQAGVKMTESKTDEVIKEAIKEESFKALMAARRATRAETGSAAVGAADAESIKIGVTGSGQAGSRLAETFYNLGYLAIAINTARQDLDLLG